MENNQIPNKFSIDSVRCRIENDINKVQIIDRTLIDRFVYMNIRTGAIDSDSNQTTPDGIPLGKSKSIIKDSNGIKTKFAVVKKQVSRDQITKRPIVKECIVFSVNAKMLELDYMQGITIENLRKVYDYIISFGVISIDYETFLNEVDLTDLDYKADVLTGLSYEQQKKYLVTSLDSISIPRREKHRGVNLYRRKDNIGVEWNDRKEERNAISAPFAKVYNKSLELEKRSKQFKDQYRIKAPSDLVRFEYTVKDRKHGKHLFGVERMTFNSMLNLTKEQEETGLVKILEKCVVIPTDISEILKIEKGCNLSNAERMLLHINLQRRLLQLPSEIIDMYWQAYAKDLEYFSQSTVRREKNSLQDVLSGKYVSVRSDKDGKETKKIEFDINDFFSSLGVPK